MATADPVTSVSLRTSTLRRLQAMKTGTQTWDQFFLGWLDWAEEREELEEAFHAIGEIRSGRAKTAPESAFRKQIDRWARQ